VVLDERLADAQLALIDTFLDGGNTLPVDLRDKLCKGMCTDEATLYADLIERIAKMEYARKYKELTNAQKAGGTIAIVAIVVEATIKKPEDASASWPHVGDLKTASDKLKIKYLREGGQTRHIAPRPLQLLARTAPRAEGRSLLACSFVACTAHCRCRSPRTHCHYRTHCRC